MEQTNLLTLDDENTQFLNKIVEERTDMFRMELSKLVLKPEKINETIKKINILIAEASLFADGLNIQYIRGELRNNQLIGLAVGCSEGLALQYLNDNEITPEIALMAVKLNGLALEFVKELKLSKNDLFDIISESIKQNPHSIKFIDRFMKYFTEKEKMHFYKMALRLNGDLIQFIESPNEELCCIAVKTMKNFEFLMEKFKNDEYYDECYSYQTDKYHDDKKEFICMIIQQAILLKPENFKLINTKYYHYLENELDIFDDIKKFVFKHCNEAIKYLLNLWCNETIAVNYDYDNKEYSTKYTQFLLEKDCEFYIDELPDFISELTINYVSVVHDEKISCKKLPENLKSLIIDTNLPYKIPQLPLNLKILKITNCCCIKELPELPESLEILEICDLSYIQFKTFPPNLINLKIGRANIYYYQYELPPLPQTLKSFEFLDSYCTKNFLELPQSLENIKICSIPNIKFQEFPQNLKVFQYGCYHKQEVSYNYELPPLPQTLEIFRFLCSYSFEFKEFPPNLEVLEIGPNYQYELTNLPKSLEELSIAKGYVGSIKKLPVFTYIVSECCIDRECITNTKTFCCGNFICSICYDKLPKNSKCPVCRNHSLTLY